MVELHEIFKDREPNLENPNILKEKIAHQAMRVQTLKSPISDCVQWFCAAFLARNTPEAI